MIIKKILGPPAEAGLLALARGYEHFLFHPDIGRAGGLRRRSPRLAAAGRWGWPVVLVNDHHPPGVRDAREPIS